MSLRAKPTNLQDFRFATMQGVESLNWRLKKLQPIRNEKHSETRFRMFERRWNKVIKLRIKFNHI